MKRSRIVRGIWAACLLLAALNHLRILLQHGLSWDYHGLGWASAAYLSSLTVLDPLVAVLLFARPRIGAAATIVLIVTNVAHNLAVTAAHVPGDEFLARVVSAPQLLGQVAFMVFVLATARTASAGDPAREP